MVCDVCGEDGAKIRKMTRSIGRGRASFLIEGVPVVTCPSCGESYLTAETLKEIERIRLHWRQLTSERTVRVAKFGHAA